MNEHKNPWTLLSTKPIYENPWLSLREDQVINPKGGRGIYGVVDFKNMAIGVVPIDAEGNTYLVGQYRYPLNEYSWEIPEGGGPHGISALESAKRELKEETGFTAATWIDIGRIHTSNSVTSEFGYLFLAQDLTAGDMEHEETEDLIIKKVPFAEAVRLVMAGEITDALSIAGILKADKIINHSQ